MKYTIEQIKEEIAYYTGKTNVSDDEAKQIMYYVNELGSNLYDVVSAYYSC